MGYYLLIKEAKELQLKYLCKCADNKDHISYKGSGSYWLSLIKKYNPTIETTVLGHYATNEQLKAAGEYYSTLFNVVGSVGWANIIPELGDGGPTVLGRVRAYNPDNDTEQGTFMSTSEIPEGWVRGCRKWKKSVSGVEKTRLAHLGKKRNAKTRLKMSEAVRNIKKITCGCGKTISLSNFAKHRKVCDG